MNIRMATTSTITTTQSPGLNCFEYSSLPLMPNVALPKADRNHSRRASVDGINSLPHLRQPSRRWNLHHLYHVPESLAAL